MQANNLGDKLATDDGAVPELASRVKERMVRIVLEENDNIPPTGQFISVNGRTWMLRPGEEVDVPMAVVNVLDNAVQDVPQIDPATKQVVGYRKRLRFPYQLKHAQAA